MKIKQLKIINQDQSTEVADIGADAVNIDYNDSTVKAELDKLNTDNNVSKNNITNLQSGLSTTSSNLALQTSRIDNLAHLDEGSTTGDAELIDGRTDFIGNTYTNIGDNIRRTATVLNDRITDINEAVRERKIYKPTLANGTLANPGNDRCVRSTDLIPFTYGEIAKIKIDKPLAGENYNYVYGYDLIREDGTTLTRIGLETGHILPNDEFFIVGHNENIKYLRICIGEYNSSTSTWATLRTTSFKDDIFIEIGNYNKEVYNLDYLNDKIINLEKVLGESYYYSTVMDGSLRNPGNTYLIHTDQFIECKAKDTIEVIINKPLQNSSNRYVFGWSYYEEDGTAVSLGDIDLNNHTNKTTVPNSTRVKKVKLVIGEYNDETQTYATLRSNDFLGYSVCLKNSNNDNVITTINNTLATKYDKKNAENQQIYFENSAKLYFEKDGSSNIYFTFTSRIVGRVNFSFYHDYTVLNVSVGEDYVTTSPLGKENCIKIPSTYCLVYDRNENSSATAFKVMTREATIDNNRYIHLFDNVGGIIIGGALKWYYDTYQLTFPSKIVSGQIYFDKTSQLHFESDNDGKIYFAYTGGMRGRVYFGFDVTQSILATYVGEDYIGTSPSGVENCIIIPESYDLVYDMQESTVATAFKILPRTDCGDGKRFIHLFDNISGRVVYGIFKPEYEHYLLNLKIDNKDAIPSYWQGTIDTKIGTIRNNLVDTNSKFTNFFFITDQHWISNAQKSSNLIKYLSKKVNISLVLSGGDIVNSDQNTQLKAINELENYVSTLNDGYLQIFSTYGNHDFNNVLADSDPANALNRNQIYDAYIKQIENSYYKANTYNRNVMYIDNESEHTRIISFACYNHRGQTVEEDIKTAISTLVNELDNTWSIIFFCHTYWNTSSTIDGVAANYANYIAALSHTCNATIIALFTGHVHNDLNTIVTADNGGKLLVISTHTDSFRQNNAVTPRVYEMTEGTTTEQAFDIVQIDKTNRKIYMTRIGAGSDREFEY